MGGKGSGRRSQNQFQAKRAGIVTAGGENFELPNLSGQQSNPHNTVESFPTGLTAGSIVFSDGSHLSQNNANFFWDDTNERFGIGTNNPLFQFHVKNDINSLVAWVIENPNMGNAATSIFSLKNGDQADLTDSISMIVVGQGTTTSGRFVQNSGLLEAASDLSHLGLSSANAADGHIRFYTQGNNERMRLDTDGNLGIGTDSPDGLIHAESASTADIISKSTGGASRLILDRGGVNKKSEIHFKTATANKWYAGLSDSNDAGNGTEFYIGQSAGGANANFWIETNGNVGIGTDNPNAKMEVKTTGSDNLRLSYDDSNYMDVHVTNIGRTWFTNAGSSAQTIFSHPTTPNFRLYEGADQRFSLIAGGATDLTNSNGAGDIRINQDDTSGRIFFKIENAHVLSILNNGNVGINTSSPDTKLQVVGDCKFGDDNTNFVEISGTGDMVFNGAAGLPFGEIYAYDTNTTITIAGTGIANKVQVTSFAVDGASNNMTPDHTNDHITVTKAGIYKCSVSISAESTGGTAYEAGFGVYKNNGATLFQNCHVHRQLSGGGGDTGSMSMTGLIDLAVNDTIEVWVWNETNTNNIIIDDINLNLVQIGGT